MASIESLQNTIVLVGVACALLYIVCIALAIKAQKYKRMKAFIKTKKLETEYTEFAIIRRELGE